MRSHRTLLAVLLALSLATLANAGTRSTSDAGTYIAPGVETPESIARAIPDGAGGAFIGFAVSGGMGIARIGPDGLPAAGWTAHVAPVSNPKLDSGFPGFISRALPDAVWQFSPEAEAVGPPQTWYALAHADWPTEPDVPVVASVRQSYTVAVALDDQRTLVQSFGFNPQWVLRTNVLHTTGAIDALPDVPLPGTFPLAGYCSNASIPDGAGGAWTLLSVQNVNTASDMDVVVVRFGANGLPAWSPPVRVVTGVVRRQAPASICGDGAGGAYIAWADNRDLSASQDVYAMHMLADGNRASGWVLNGNRITAQPGDQFQVKLVEDGAGGCWMVWTDSRTGTNQIYFTRLKGDGSAASGYLLSGRALAAAPSSQIDPAVVADGAGGFFCAWLDDRNGDLDLFGQHIHTSGVVVPGWDANGTALCTEPTPQDDPWLVLSSPNHALAVWSDTRVGAPRYYAMALPADGAVNGVGPSAGAGLRLASTGSVRELEFSLSASDAGEIRLEVFDASGRRVAEVQRQGPLAGERVRIAAALHPGLYLARAGQHGATAVSRAVLIR